MNRKILGIEIIPSKKSTFELFLETATYVALGFFVQQVAVFLHMAIGLALIVYLAGVELLSRTVFKGV